jgi:hypothetical protein
MIEAKSSSSNAAIEIGVRTSSQGSRCEDTEANEMSPTEELYGPRAE